MGCFYLYYVLKVWNVFEKKIGFFDTVMPDMIKVTQDCIADRHG